MFTPSEIEGAFRRLFGLYNEEKVWQLKSAFKEEIEGISPELLARLLRDENRERAWQMEWVANLGSAGSICC